MRITIREHTATIGNQEIINLANLPEPLHRPIMDAIAARLRSNGYQVSDQRPQQARTCQRCGEPITSNRAKYCPACQVATRQENIARFYAR